jgi:hypothetical protein
MATRTATTMPTRLITQTLLLTARQINRLTKTWMTANRAGQTTSAQTVLFVVMGFVRIRHMTRSIAANAALSVRGTPRFVRDPGVWRSPVRQVASLRACVAKRNAAQPTRFVAWCRRPGRSVSLSATTSTVRPVVQPVNKRAKKEATRGRAASLI